MPTKRELEQENAQLHEALEEARNLCDAALGFDDKENEDE